VHSSCNISVHLLHIRSNNREVLSWALTTCEVAPTTLKSPYVLKFQSPHNMPMESSGCGIRATTCSKRSVLYCMLHVDDIKCTPTISMRPYIVCMVVDNIRPCTITDAIILLLISDIDFGIQKNTPPSLQLSEKLNTNVCVRLYRCCRWCMSSADP
jgi:hypothetical protein